MEASQVMLGGETGLLAYVEDAFARISVEGATIGAKHPSDGLGASAVRWPYGNSAIALVYVSLFLSNLTGGHL